MKTYKNKIKIYETSNDVTLGKVVSFVSYIKEYFPEMRIYISSKPRRNMILIELYDISYSKVREVTGIIISQFKNSKIETDFIF